MLENCAGGQLRAHLVYASRGSASRGICAGKVDILRAGDLCDGICAPEFDQFGSSAHENFRISSRNFNDLLPLSCFHLEQVPPKKAAFAPRDQEKFCLKVGLRI